MKKRVLAGVALAVSLPLSGLSLPAAAQPDHGWHGDNHGSWDPANHYDGRRHQERRLSRHLRRPPTLAQDALASSLETHRTAS